MSKRGNHREVRDYLNDIIETIRDIQHFTKGISYDGLMKDKKTLYAVIRCLEVLGEAVKNVPQAIRRRYSEVPWQEISGMRDKLIHEYFGVDTVIIWDTIREDMSSLEKAARNILKEIK